MLDLKKLEAELDEKLAKETTESLNKWLEDIEFREKIAIESDFWDIINYKWQGLSFNCYTEISKPVTKIENIETIIDFQSINNPLENLYNKNYDSDLNYTFFENKFFKSFNQLLTNQITNFNNEVSPPIKEPNLDNKLIENTEKDPNIVGVSFFN